MLYSPLPGLHAAVKMILLLSYLTNEVVVTKCLWELLVLILGVQVDCHIRGFSYPLLAAAQTEIWKIKEINGS